VTMESDLADGIAELDGGEVKPTGTNWHGQRARPGVSREQSLRTLRGLRAPGVRGLETSTKEV